MEAVSSFFWRNPLQQQIVMGLFRTLYDPDETRRVLDVGTGSGEFTLTYAMLLRDEYGEDWHERFPITAIDKDPVVSEQCTRGIYPMNRLYQMPRPYRSRYFRELQTVPAPFGRAADGAKPQLLALFKNVTLQRQITWLCQDFEDFADAGSFALAFCQNTLLHLPDEQAGRFLHKLFSLLAPGGFLVCAGRPPGACETLHELGFAPVPHDVQAVYAGWIQRKHSKNPAIQLKEYEPVDPLLAYRIGSIFQKGKA